MKVLFTHSYFLKLDAKQLKTAMPYPPLATLYAMAYLRENNFEVKLFDTTFCNNASEINQTIDEFKPQIVVIYDDGFNYLTKMCLTNMRHEAFKMQNYAKSKGAYVITSSSDATDNIAEYAANNSDCILIGEAEQTLLEVCNAYKNNTDITLIKGVALIQNNKLIKTPARIVIKDLDSLPHAAWDLLNISPYKTMWFKHHGYFSINFVTTRGCPYKCNWCAKPIYGNRYNSHSPQNCVKQLLHLQKKFGFTHVWFADDIFGLKPGWLNEFNNTVQQENLQINYKIQSRADLLLEEDNIKNLANSGCKTVWMGAESGSQKILDAMDKGTTVEQIYKAAALLKKYKINTALFLQFGYLGEDINDINATLKMLLNIVPDEIGISISYPLPGTVFYEKVKSELITKTNWTDSDDLDLMFTSTYSKPFYKTLHRYVHKKYRIKKSTVSLKNLMHFNFTKNTIYNVASIGYYYPTMLFTKHKLKTLQPDVATSIR